METKIESSTAGKQTGNFHPFSKSFKPKSYLALIIIKAIVYLVIMSGITVFQRLNGSNLSGQQLLHAVHKLSLGTISAIFFWGGVYI
jgi:hypothetical protein